MATPLKVSSVSKAEQTKETSGPMSGPSGADAVLARVEDISSAHELTAFVNISHLARCNHFTEYSRVTRSRICSPKSRPSSMICPLKCSKKVNLEQHIFWIRSLIPSVSERHVCTRGCTRSFHSGPDQRRCTSATNTSRHG